MLTSAQHTSDEIAVGQTRKTIVVTKVLLVIDRLIALLTIGLQQNEK